MALTEAEAQAVFRVVRGLNPRHDNNGLARPSLQQTHDALALLCERAARVMQAGTLLESERVALRQLVDDLYRVEPQPGPAMRVISWDYREPPDVDELTAAINQVGGGAVHAREVDDGSQEYIVVISRQPLDDTAALAAWEASR